MNSKISCSRLLATALSGLVLAGCNAVEDVKDEPFVALPNQTVVLGGRIKDLGTRRPLILQYNGTDTCLVPEVPNAPTGRKIVSECKFVGVLDQEYSLFSFGAVPVGTPYNVTVKEQPFGKICSVVNPAGTARADGDEIEVVCVDDVAVPHYTVTVNISAAAASKPGLKVILTTENGTCPVAASGLSSFTFSPALCPNSPAGYHQNAAHVLDSQFNLPVFKWRVTATIPGATEVAAPTNCFVTGGPVVNTGGNEGDDGNATVAPTGNVTVTVASCGFTVRAQADYSPHTAPAPAMASGDGITLLLRSQPWGIDVAAARITSFANTFVPFMVPDAQGNPTATAYEAQSDPEGFYEVVVKSSPAGMACMPGASVSSSGAPTSTRAVGHWTDAGAVLLRQPASGRVASLWVVDRVIRCRLTPTDPARRLRGVYQQSTITSTRTIVGSAAPVDVVATVRNHNYLAFFEDGMYLYGNHSSTAANNGLEQGFYDYNPTTGQIVFTAFTDTNGGSGLHAVATAGSAVGAPIAKTLVSVVKSAGASPSVITARFSAPATTSTTTDGITTTITTTVDWRMTEAGQDPLVSTYNAMDGAWVTWDPQRQVQDPRRVFVYQHGLYNAFHMGVNGIANLQEACYVGNFGLSGTWTRQGGRSGCNMRVYTDTVRFDGSVPTSTFSLLSSGSADIPNPTVALQDYPGRWPQSQNPDFTDGRPYSLVEYEIRLAGSVPADPICPAADKLTVWDTAHGTRKDTLTPAIPAIVLCRVTAN